MNMMNVIDRREPVNTLVAFSTLSVGQPYEDCAGNVCIKINNDDGEDSGCGNCLCDHGGAKWAVEQEPVDALVHPIEVQLIIIK